MVDKVLGAKVRIEVKEEGSYEGFVHNIDGKTNKLTLVKVMSCATGTRLHGLHHFFPKEITELTVLEQKTEDVHCSGSDERPRNKTTTSSSSDVSDNQTLANEPLNLDQEVEENQDIPKESWNKKKKTKTVSDNGLHFKHQKNFKKNMQKAKPMRRDPSDEGPSLLRRKPVKPSNYHSEVFVDTTDDRENFTVNPPDVVVIDSLGEMFEKAVAYISRQRVVGVAWEGIQVGRFGNLCLIQVIHDCRHLSDALYHQYGVSLVNVFDTQVADVIIYRNEANRQLPRQTSSLISSLYEYLDLCPDEYHFHKIRLKHIKNDEFVWRKRPLPKDLLDAAAKCVMYLRELRLAQMERMMDEFIFGVDIYLSYMRDASDEFVKKKYSSTALPEMFHQLPKPRDRPRYRQLDPELDDSNEREDPRQAWQEGHTFLEEYEKRGMRIKEHKYPPLTEELGNSTSLNENSEMATNLPSNFASAMSKLNMSNEPPVSPQGQSVHRISENTSKFHSTGRGKMALWRPGEGMFSQDDFPQLSSDSDSSGPSPNSSGLEGIMQRRNVSGMSSSDSRLGRGRASALIRNARLPKARLPADNRPGRSTSIGNGGYDRLQFPTDEELLSVPEIVSASELRGLPSGTRVRVSHQLSKT